MCTCDISSERIVLFMFCVMRHDSAKHHMLGSCALWRGLWPPNSNSAEIFVQCTYPQVSSSYVYSFGSYRVDTQTHPQTNRCHREHPMFFATLRHWVTSNVTGCDRGPKRKLWAGYRALSLKRMSCCDAFSSSSVVSHAFCALCVYSTFGPLCQILFLSQPALLG